MKGHHSHNTFQGKVNSWHHMLHMKVRLVSPHISLKSKYFSEQYFCKPPILYYSLISRLISLCHTDLDCHPQSTSLHIDPVGKRNNSLYLSHKPTCKQKNDRTEPENKIPESSWPGKNKVFNLTLCGGFSHKKTEVCN